MTSLSGLGTKQRRTRRTGVLLPILSALMLIAALAVFGMELIAFSQQQNRIPSDVSVAGVNVGGLGTGEAVARWEAVYAEPIVLYYGDSPILLDPAAVGFRTNNEVMVAAARSTGNTGSVFWWRFWNHLVGAEVTEAQAIPLTADYQQSLLRSFLIDIAERYDQQAGGVAYDLETLTIRSGDAGRQLDVNLALTMIERALFSPTERSVQLPVNSTATYSTDINTLRELIIAYLDSNNFIYDGQTTVASVYILDLQTGEEVNILGDVSFSAASTQKLPILIQYYRYLTFAPSQEEAWLMANSLLCSNNSSSNLMLQIVGGGNLFTGLQRMNETMQYVGAGNTYMSAPFDLGVAGQQLGSIGAPATSPNPNYNTRPDPYNRTTAEDLGILLTQVYDCAYYGSGLAATLPDAFNQTECRQMLELMSANDLLRLLQGGIPEGVRISHKNGWIFDMVGDAGIVFSPNGRHYVISVFLWEEAEFQDFERLWPLLEDISRAAWNYFNPEEALISRRDNLPFTAQDCIGTYLPPDMESVDLNDINGWRRNTSNAGS